MDRIPAASPAMDADVFGVVGDEHIDIAAHRPQSMALIAFSPNVYRNATFTGGAYVADRDPVLGAPSVNVMVQVPAGDTPSPLSPAASFPLSADELMIARPPAIQTTIIFREVEVGPGITLGYHSLDDYKFITSLVVIEED